MATTARFRFDDQKAANDLLAKAKKVRVSKAMNKEICKLIEKEVKGNARKGKPLNNSRRFKSLRSLTIKQRNYLKNFNKTHSAFAPRKSNLTFSGQLIDAFKCTFKNGFLTLEIGDKSRRAYKTGPNSRQKNPPTNAELYGYLLKISRGFTLFTRKGIKTHPNILKKTNSIIRKTLRKALK